jgi:hypothetical protein
MKETTVKYGDGNWLFIKCVMDQQVYDLLHLTPVFRGFRPESCVQVSSLYAQG